jgi:putative phage-type endonuclease
MACIFVPCEQGSPEWKEARLGKVTASKFSDVMTNGKCGQPSETAKSYMMDLIAESLTGIASDDIKANALEWGKRHEAEARAAYSWLTGYAIDQVGFAIHGSMPFVGASSDGLIEDRGGIELKCPYNSTVHLKTLLTQKIPKDYIPQVQGGLWVLERDWMDFTSYDPRMPETHRLAIVRAYRDEKYISELQERVEAFLGEMATLTEQIAEAAKKFREVAA